MALAQRFDVLARSPVYETAPVGPPQPNYLNAAVRVRTTREAHAILQDLLAIESTMGRVRNAAERWGPRIIDLDLLWIDGVIVTSETLTVPHARLTERAFALSPLLDVAPGAVDPRTKRRYARPIDAGAIRRTELTL